MVFPEVMATGLYSCEVQSDPYVTFDCNSRNQLNGYLWAKKDPLVMVIWHVSNIQSIFIRKMN